MFKTCDTPDVTTVFMRIPNTPPNSQNNKCCLQICSYNIYTLLSDFLSTFTLLRLYESKLPLLSVMLYNNIVVKMHQTQLTTQLYMIYAHFDEKKNYSKS